MTAHAEELDAIAAEERFGAHNYHPLPVVLARGEGVWVEDVEGRRYFDALSAYSALNFGHRHPALVRAATEQLERLTLTSRAFHNDQLGPFCAELASFCGHDRVLPMNTGAEAVETAIKLARRWGYDRKGVAPDRAQVVVCARATSTGAPRRSWASPTIRSPTRGSARTARASSPSPTATRPRCAPPSRRTRWPSSSSPSRARAA